MLTICQLCGDKGYSAALIYCEKCEEYARHGYCMDVLPEVNDENVTWFCEDCKPDLAKQPILDKLRCPPSPSSVLKESDTVRTNRPCGPIKKNQKVPSNSVSKNKMQKPSYNELQCRKNNNEVSSDLVSKNKLQKPSYNELQCKENVNEDQKFRKRQKLVHEDDTTKPLNTSKVAVSDLKPLKIVEGSVNTGHAEKSQVHMNDSLPIGNVLQSRKKQCRDPKLKNQQESKRLKFSANHKSSDFLKDTVTSVSLAKARLQKNPDKDPRLRKKGRLVIKKKVKPSEFSDSLLKSSNVLQEKAVGGSVARTEVLIRDSTISPSSNEPENNETCDPKFKTKQELVIEKKVKPAEFSDSGLKSSTVSQEKVVGGSVATKEVLIHDNTISPSSNEPGNNETCDTKVKTQQELVIEKVGSVEISNAGLMSSIVLQEKVVGGSVATTEVPIRDVTISPSGDEPKNKEKCNPKFETKQRSLVESVEAAEPLKTIEVTPTDPNPSNMLEYNCYVEPQPLLEPMWRGSFVIHNIESKCIGRVLVAAHWSNLASSKACEMRNLLPELVSVELSTRSHCWPIKFQHWGPSIHSVGLFCLPQDRDDKTYDILVNDMINGDFAMRALLENVELLVFTSYVLPFHYKMFHSRYYLWGIFRDRQASGVRTGATRGMKGYPEFSTNPVMSFSHSGSYVSYFLLAFHFTDITLISKENLKSLNYCVSSFRGEEGGTEDNPRKVDKSHLRYFTTREVIDNMIVLFVGLTNQQCRDLKMPNSNLVVLALIMRKLGWGPGSWVKDQGSGTGLGSGVRAKSRARGRGLVPGSGSKDWGWGCVRARVQGSSSGLSLRQRVRFGVEAASEVGVRVRGLGSGSRAESKVGVRVWGQGSRPRGVEVEFM
ncbi:hypothetical protein G4B88_004976 [Cannabis sativa]|uniref:Zinc finger PHD-type domain-containing protein n=1 Tax=Cannabis sativa TaxID=3483 RepID=A0A7J6G083_CANSA|nr:hypothetical protein G4B88_004976 [Cannabis sativa]